jgi:hypothetical protein
MVSLRVGFNGDSGGEAGRALEKSWRVETQTQTFEPSLFSLEIANLA